MNGIGRLASPPMVAPVCVMGVGCGVLIALSGAVVSAPVPMVLGGALAAFALTTLLSLDLVDGLALVVCTAALPGLTLAGGDRLTVAAPLTALVVVGWVAHRIVARVPVVPDGIPVRSLTGLGIALALSVAWSQTRLLSIREFLNLAVLLAFLLPAVGLLRRDLRLVDRLLPLLVAIAALSGVAAVLEMVGVIPGVFPLVGRSSLYRAGGVFGQPNALGMFLAAVLPLAVILPGRVVTVEARLAARVAMVLIVGGLVATVSRGSWLAVLGGTVALLVAGERRAFIRIWIGVAVMAVVVDVLGGGLIRDTVLRSVGDWVIAQRFALMAAGLLMFVTYPWLGVGLGGFGEHVERFGAAVPALGDIKTTPHNAYIQMGAEAGVIGLAAYVVFLAAVWITLARGVRAGRHAGLAQRRSSVLRAAILWSFTTSCLSGMVEWPLVHGVGQVLMLIVAMGLAIQTRDTP